jgi:hypothetical protein
MSSTGEPVSARVLFFERNNRDGKENYRILPFYLVNVSGAKSGKMFEPRECSARVFGNTISTGHKFITRIQEFDGKAKMFNCEQTDQGLHSFQSWEWPLA